MSIEVEVRKNERFLKESNLKGIATKQIVENGVRRTVTGTGVADDPETAKAAARDDLERALDERARRNS